MAGLVPNARCIRGLRKAWKGVSRRLRHRLCNILTLQVGKESLGGFFERRPIKG